MRILFVDDEEAVLSGLRRMLRRHAPDWQPDFALGGDAALGLLRDDRYDVVVTDMRMPGVDGADVLHAARGRHPGTVRIVLSGHSEMAIALRAVPLAHQFLTKPCDPLELRGAVERALRLQDTLDRTGLLPVIGGVHALPSPPAAVRQLEAILIRREVDVDQVIDVVAADPAISAKLLQLVNSAFFGVARRVADIGTAVRYLGIVTVRDLAVAVHAFSSLTGDGVVGHLVEDIQAHSEDVAELTQLLIGAERDRHEAFAAALLHDVGRLVLAVQAGTEYVGVVQRAAVTDRPLPEVEREAFGASHAEVGALLLSLWGLPYSIIEVVLTHHEPRVPQAPFTTADATYLAEQLLHAMPGGHDDTLRARGALAVEAPVGALLDDVWNSPAVVRALDVWRAGREQELSA